MLTPEGLIQAAVPDATLGAPRASHTEVASSASPSFCKRGKVNYTMKRTPQPALTQSKLTSMLQVRGGSDNGGHADAGPPAAPRAVTLDAIEMDTSDSSGLATAAATTAAAVGMTGGNAPITADFLLKALKENSEHLMKSFNASLGALSAKIDDNSAKIALNSTAIASQAGNAENQQVEIKNLSERVARLEKMKPVAVAAVEQRATLSSGYLLARRSLRLWPIQGDSENALWEAVGEFLHEVLGMSREDIGQEDIDSIIRPMGGRDQAERREVIVRFVDKQKRDSVVSSSPNLAGRVDREGRPTAGIRLEVPPELDDTFRLLHRFGTRLRARHGAGTKRHIKFDDFGGSLYANIKLPGDSSWTKVTPAMAREDLGASLREENAHTQKRLAAKLVPGPRERLGRPMLESRGGVPTGMASTRTNPQDTADPSPGQFPSGKRPRWSVPDRRPPL